jgi:transposase
MSSKYVDHLPLRRLEGIFARQGIDLARATLCGWVADIGTALTAIGEQLAARSRPPAISRPMTRRHGHR